LRRPRSLDERLRSPGSPLLPRPAFDAWLAHSGSVALRRAAARLPLPFLFRRLRARHALYAEIRRALDSDSRIRTSLAASFATLPRVLTSVASVAHAAQLLPLVHREASRRLVAVPRAAVVRRLARDSLDSLGALPTLAPYEGLAAFLVGSLAVEAELAFVDTLRRYLPAASDRPGAMIAAVDRDSVWGGVSPAGHYWIAETSISSLDLGREPDRRRFAATLERSLAQARGDVAELDPAQCTSILARLLEVLSARPSESPRPRRRSPSGVAIPSSALAQATTVVLASPGQPLAPSGNGTPEEEPPT
jgi:hypothetical protein